MIWNFINTWLNYKNKKQIDVQTNRMPMKSLVKKQYTLGEKVFSRAVFREGEQKNGYKVFHYEIKDLKNGNILENIQKERLIERLEDYDKRINGLSNRKPMQTDKIKFARLNMIIGKNNITVPDFLIPELNDGVCNFILKEIEKKAREFGIKIHPRLIKLKQLILKR